jgi:predicted SAM-dependent methyltransferase
MSIFDYIKTTILNLPNKLLNLVHQQIRSNYRLIGFKKDLNLFNSLVTHDLRFPDSSFSLRPFLFDKNIAIPFDRHYFYHPAWASRVLAEICPSKHIDISSILHFSGVISAFIPTEYYEFQAPNLALADLKTGNINLLKLSFDNNSIESLSCMHVIEHVGLGRYGDPIDPKGDLKSASELQRVLRPGGNLLVVVPVGGKARIEFNAHRVYTFDMVVEMFPLLKLVEFSLIPDRPEDGGLVRKASRELSLDQNYGCGCFHFIKSGQKIAKAKD